MEIRQLVAQYKFDKSIYDNLLPEFNAEFTDYTYEDIVDGEIITRTIYTLKDKTINIKNDSSYPTPGIIDDIIQYSCSPWEVATFDLSEYAGKNVDISFTITTKTEKWCKFEINNKVGSYETICDIWEPDSAIKIFDYNTTIENIPNDFKIVLEGMNGIVSNINIIVEGENLFPSKLITEHYLYENMNCYSTTPTLHDDNTLEFTTHWRRLYVNIQDYKNKNLHVSFDIKGEPNDIDWSEFEYAFVNSNEQNYDMIENHIFYTTLTEEMNYHVEFDAMVTENTHFYLGGMGGHIENLQILVDNDLPTLMRFGNEDAKANSLLEILYLDTSNIIDMSYMFNGCSNLTKVYNTCMVSHTDIDLPISNMVTFIAHEESEWVTPEYINDKDPETKMSVTVSKANSITDYGTKAYFNMDSKKIPYNATITKATLNCTFSRSFNLLAESYCRIYVNETDYISETALSKQGNRHTITVDLTDYVNNLLNGEVFIAASAPTNIEYGFYIYEAVFTIDYDEEFITFSDTSNVTSMSSMFENCQSLTSIDVSNFDTSNVTTMSYMFSNCINLTSLDLSNFDTSNVTSMSIMFYNCNQLTSLDVSNFDTSNVTTMNSMFYNCRSLTSIDVSNFDTSNVTNMTYMFYNHELLTSLDVSNFDTSNVTKMNNMFDSCNKLTSIDVSNFNTSNVTKMGYMFAYCKSLTSLDLSNWDTNNVTDMSSMFNSCNSLTSISMNNSDYNSVNKIISKLKTRTEDSPGTLNIVGIDDYSQVDLTTAESKFWNIESGEEPKPEASNLLKIGDTIINNIYIGDSQVLKICLGAVLIYEAPFK